MFGQSLLVVCMKYPKMKLIVGAISLRSFWQKWSIISGDKCYVNTRLKWNPPKQTIRACEFFIKTKTVDQKFKTKTNFMLFLSQWKLIKTEICFRVKLNFISSRFHFGSHVNALYLNVLFINKPRYVILTEKGLDQDWPWQTWAMINPIH